MIIHSKGVIRYANRACIKLLGASSLNQLIDLPVNRFAYLQFLDVTNERIETMKDIGVEIVPFEEKIVNLDGKILDVEVTEITINHEGAPAFLMIFRDITSRKKAEEALQQSEEQYRLIAENMSDLVGVVDTKGVILYASPSHEHVLGYSPKEIEGNPGIELMHPDDMEKMKSKYKKRVTEMEDHSIEFRMKHKKGHWVWIEAHIKQLLDERNYVLRIQFVGRDITERKIFEEKLNYMAFYDALTGIPNRRLFQEKLMQIIKETNRYERKFAIIYMDIDDFKGINDMLGHDAGDELLKQFAKRVQFCLRESDTFARQGGDEFTILLCEIKEEQDAVIIAERILAALQNPWTISNYEFTTTSSLGVAFYPKDGTSFAELMKYADKAMYEAKETGKNMVRVYDNK
ncbi:diguanylate cyclase domain-containing protein [Ureibacillus chungkukjangi]|uniref:diguanylate cyclase domain-containing protein n=1 Tax=Ureibacillus chungkukjangi TaxID=1202712 RepID=UPI00384B8BD5